MPVHKTFTDELWARIQDASTVTAFDPTVGPVNFVRDLCGHVLNAPDHVLPDPSPEPDVDPNQPTLAEETAWANAAEAELSRQREIITRLLAAPQPAGQGEKLPDAPLYDGSRDELRAFVTHLRLKLLSDQGRYPTARQRVAYAVGRLRGRAMQQLIPFIREDGETASLDDVEDVIRILQATFGDPDAAATARHKLQALRQGNKEFSAYYAEFSRLVSELNWDERATMDALRNGLSIEILEKLIGLPPATNLRTFVDQCQHLDSQIRAIDNLRKLRTGSRTTSHATPRAAPPAFAPAPAQRPAPPSTPYYGPAPMDLSANRRKITPQERAARLAEGRCLYCGGHGHMAAACPNKPATLRAAAVAPNPVPETPLSDEESGNA